MQRDLNHTIPASGEQKYPSLSTSFQETSRYAVQIADLLFRAGYTNLVELTELPEPTSSQRRAWDLSSWLSYFKRFEDQTESPLLTTLAICTGLRELHRGAFLLQNHLFSWKFHQAKLTINKISRIPPPSSQHLTDCEFVLSQSTSSGCHSGLFRDLIERRLTELYSTLSELLQANHVSLKTLKDSSPSSIAKQEMMWLLQALWEHLQAIEWILQQELKRAEQGLRASTLLRGNLSYQGFAQKMQIFEVDQFAPGAHQPIRALYQELAAGDLFQTLLRLNEKFENLVTRVEALHALPTPALQPQTDRDDGLLAYANYLFLARLSRQLEMRNESKDDIKHLCEQLFAYANQNRVHCDEILEEEIFKFAPKINKETIRTARMEVRLNDQDYPLSVAHKDHLMKTFGQMTNDALSFGSLVS